MRFEEARGTLANAYMAAIPLISLNVYWFLFSLPLVTAPPALGALYFATNRLANDQDAGWATFWQGFRNYFWLSWRWGLMNVVFIGLIAVNLWFYGRLEANWAQIPIVGLLMFWGILQAHTYPLLLEQEAPRLLTAMRNSAVIFFRRPLQALTLAIGLVLVAAISTLYLFPAWFFITAGLMTYWSNRAVVNAIEQMVDPGSEG